MMFLLQLEHYAPVDLTQLKHVLVVVQMLDRVKTVVLLGEIAQRVQRQVDQQVALREKLLQIVLSDSLHRRSSLAVDKFTGILLAISKIKVGKASITKVF